jgi:hypothetical protein
MMTNFLKVLVRNPALWPHPAVASLALGEDRPSQQQE